MICRPSGAITNFQLYLMTPREASLTAQMPFQHCLQCSREGLSLRHWRWAWAFDCRVCGTKLVQTLGKAGDEPISDKLIYRARRGAGMLECAARSQDPRQLRRAMRVVTFAMSLKGCHGEPLFALQSHKPEVRLFCLAAIAAARSHPLAKAAIVSSAIDDFARIALLRAFEKEHRLLAAVDNIAQRRARSKGPMKAESRN